MTHSDVTQAERLAAMGRALTAIANTGSSIRRNEDGPNNKSEAAADHAWWADQEYDDALFVEMIDSGLKSLFAAEDFLRAAAVGMRSPSSPFSTMALLRASLEASGRARWLFAPDLDAVGRVQRFARETGDAIRGSRGIAKTLDIEDPDLEEEGHRIEAMIEAFASQTGGWKQSTPNLTDRVMALFLDELATSDAKTAARSGKVSYQMLSDAAHSTRRGLDTFLPGMISRGVNDPPTDHQPGWFEYFAWAAGWGYIVASQRAFDYLGWDDRLWRAAVVTFGGELSNLRGDEVSNA